MSLSPITITAVACSVGVALIFPIFIAPRFLRRWLGVRPGAAKTWRDRVELRFQNLDTGLWMFARFKLRLDTMFRELPEFLKDSPNLRTALDLGCGRGVAGCALLEWFPDLTLYGIDPHRKSVRAAAAVFGPRGRVFQVAAPDFEVPELPDRLDIAFALDMIHFLSDADLDLTFRRIRARLCDGAYFIVRVPMAPAGSGSILWDLDAINRKLSGTYARFRASEEICDALERADFRVRHTRVSGANRELCWFIATAGSVQDSVEHYGQDQQQRDRDVNQHDRSQVSAAEFIPPL
jgi:uncharacterized protein